MVAGHAWQAGMGCVARALCVYSVSDPNWVICNVRHAVRGVRMVGHAGDGAADQGSGLGDDEQCAQVDPGGAGGILCVNSY